MLRVALEQTDTNKFQDYLDDLVLHLRASQETKRFADYFEASWVPCKEQWAYCYRIGDGINTNMYVEAFHRVFKYNYLKGKTNRRVDNCLFNLIKVNQDKIFQRLIKLSKGKSSFRMNVVRKRHLNSLSLDVERVKEDPIHTNKWLVMSENGSHSYTVTCLQENCILENCQLRCIECGSCCHSHSCTCIDFLMNNISCKHIHLIQRARVAAGHKITNDPSMSVEYQEAEIESTYRFLQSDSVSDVERVKSRIVASLETLISEVQASHAKDQEPLKCLESQINAAKNTFRSLKENKLEALKEQHKFPSNKSIEKQSRFISTKAKRKPARIRVAKPTYSEKQCIMETISKNNNGINGIFFKPKMRNSWVE